MSDHEDIEMEEDDEGVIRIGDIVIPAPPPPACTFDSTGPRLIITHIENYFFKSYAGKQVLGPFHKSFTSIVGPNGSGKSNVIDSMLFVFGYKSQKIRCKNASVLIHNSEAHPNVQSCTVAVHFKKIIDINDDECEEVPNTGFVISRTAYKDNSASVYHIDGKRCQFKAVAKLLRENGIDLDHNRFLILQGEVEQIAMMKPIAQSVHDTGMLEYLEDIVGSSRFKKPIDILSSQVEQLNVERTEILNRVKLVEKEKDELEEPKNEAIAYLKQENEVAYNKNVLYQKYIYDSSQAKEKAEAKKQEIDDGMSDMKNKLAEFDERKKEKDKKMRELGKMLESITKVKEERTQKFNVLEAEDQKLQEDLKHKNQKRKKLKSQVKAEEEKLEDLKNAPEKNRKDIEECEGLKSNLEEKRKTEEADYHKAMESLNAETQQLQDEKKTFETKLVGLKETANEKKSALNIAQSELDIYQSASRKDEQLLEKYKTSLQKSTEAKSSKQEQRQRIQENTPELQQKIQNDKTELNKVTGELNVVEQQLDAERSKLEEKRCALAAGRPRGRVLEVLMAQKSSGAIPGIEGRLGDLGGIDEKYDVAISTACGFLNHVIVRTVDTGQKCISHLKNVNAGIGNFIALEKVEQWRRNSETSIDTPENVPRLYDLVKISKPEYKTAFYFALRDTLVARDLDQATRIAYGKKRYRVVTLKGEIIEPSGAMSGGGRPQRGGMGKQASAVATIDPREVTAAENQVESYTDQFNQLRRRKVDLENSIRFMEKDMNNLRSNLVKIENDLQTAEKEIESLTKQVAEQEKKVKASQPDPKRVNELQKVLDAKIKAYETSAEAANEIEEQVNRIHKEIVDITEGKTKQKKKSLNETKKKLEKVKAEITRLQVATKTSERNYKKVSEKLTTLQAEILEAENEIKASDLRKKEIEGEAVVILNELKEHSSQEISAQEEMQEFKEEYDKVVKEENVIKSKKIEIDQELEKYDAVIKENKSKISHWKKETKRLELSEIPLDDGEEGYKEFKVLDEEELLEIDPKKLQLQISVLEEKLAQAKPNLAVLQEFKKKEEMYLQRVKILEDKTNERNDKRNVHEDLRKQRLNEFMSGFTIISNKLKEMYQMITLGGDAELELVDSLDPFSEGIVFSVRPPKKSWKNITNLSGGEKTLSSLALVFALHYYKPTPLYVMDEIDAALDFKNVSIVGNYIKERTKNAQFIIISLRSQMFELADRLTGIFKTYNCTKSVTINPSYYSKKEQIVN